MAIELHFLPTSLHILKKTRSTQVQQSIYKSIRVVLQLKFKNDFIPSVVISWAPLLNSWVFTTVPVNLFKKSTLVVMLDNKYDFIYIPSPLVDWFASSWTDNIGCEKKKMKIQYLWDLAPLLTQLQLYMQFKAIRRNISCAQLTSVPGTNYLQNQFETKPYATIKMKLKSLSQISTKHYQNNKCLVTYKAFTTK